MGSIIFQWGFNSGGYLGIPELGFYWDFIRAYLVVLNQGRYGSGQCNLLDRMLRLDAKTTLSQSYVLFITFVNITYQSGDQYLPSIYSWDSSPWQEVYIPLFFFFSPDRLFNLFVCRACILQMHNKPYQFLIQIKVCFFSNLWFCPFFKSLLLLLQLLFLLLLIINFFFYMFCFAIISHFHCLVMPRVFNIIASIIKFINFVISFFLSFIFISLLLLLLILKLLLLFIHILDFFFWLSNFSHMKRLRLGDYFVCLFVLFLELEL